MYSSFQIKFWRDNTDDNGWVKGMKVIKMELGEPDASGRRRPVPIEGSEYEIELDTVIMFQA